MTEGSNDCTSCFVLASMQGTSVASSAYPFFQAFLVALQSADDGSMQRTIRRCWTRSWHALSIAACLDMQLDRPLHTVLAAAPLIWPRHLHQPGLRQRGLVSSNWFFELNWVREWVCRTHQAARTGGLGSLHQDIRADLHWKIQSADHWKRDMFGRIASLKKTLCNVPYIQHGHSRRLQLLHGRTLNILGI